MLKNAMLIAALSGALLAGPCMAHAKLQSSSPANAAQLTEPPKTLTLKFNEAAQVAILKLLNDGKEISIAIDKNAKASQSITFPLPPLAAGNYTVQWTAVAADDGHVTKGSFAFSIKG
ncbi:MAG TPA: copper resistance CopC family protein [Steroidobacteraceae bacterium]